MSVCFYDLTQDSVKLVTTKVNTELSRTVARNAYWYGDRHQSLRKRLRKQLRLPTYRALDAVLGYTCWLFEEYGEYKDFVPGTFYVRLSDEHRSDVERLNAARYQAMLQDALVESTRIDAGYPSRGLGADAVDETECQDCGGSSQEVSQLDLPLNKVDWELNFVNFQTQTHLCSRCNMLFRETEMASDTYCYACADAFDLPRRRHGL